MVEDVIREQLSCMIPKVIMNKIDKEGNNKLQTRTTVVVRALKQYFEKK